MDYLITEKSKRIWAEACVGFNPVDILGKYLWNETRKQRLFVAVSGTKKELKVSECFQDKGIVHMLVRTLFSKYIWTKDTRSKVAVCIKIWTPVLESKMSAKKGKRQPNNFMSFCGVLYTLEELVQNQFQGKLSML